MFWSRFYERCKVKGVEPTPLCKELEISPGAATKWKNEGSLPSGANLLKIADALECSADYLLGRTDAIEIVQPFSLSEDELALLDRYSRLDADRKEILRAWALELVLGIDRGAGSVENPQLEGITKAAG